MSQTDDIQGEIEKTRSDLADTLQAIERKLSPNRIVDEAMETMRSVSIRDSHLMDLVRDNPVPLALVGLGLGWLALSSIRPAASRLEEAAEPGAEGYEREEWAGHGAGESGNGSGRIAELSDAARERTGELARNLGESAQEFTGQVRERARKATHRMRRLSVSVRNRAGEWAGRSSDVFQDHPLLIGMVAVVAGVAMGAALPRSRREAEMLGEASAGLVESARDAGRQAVRRASGAIQRAARSVGEETGEGGPVTTH